MSLCRSVGRLVCQSVCRSVWNHFIFYRFSVLFELFWCTEEFLCTLLMLLNISDTLYISEFFVYFMRYCSESTRLMAVGLVRYFPSYMIFVVIVIGFLLIVIWKICVMLQLLISIYFSENSDSKFPPGLLRARTSARKRNTFESFLIWNVASLFPSYDWTFPGPMIIGVSNKVLHLRPLEEVPFWFMENPGWILTSTNILSLGMTKKLIRM